MDAKWARPWFAVTAFAVAVEIVLTVTLAAQAKGGFFTTAGARVFNVFWFFTIQSNLIVGCTCLLLALNPDRPSAVFRVFRLIGVVAITVTFIVFHVALGKLLDLDTWGQVANQLQHTVVPVLAVVGWVAFGPRGMTSRRTAELTVAFPLLYMAATMIRGPLARHYYPYTSSSSRLPQARPRSTPACRERAPSNAYGNDWPTRRRCFSCALA